MLFVNGYWSAEDRGQMSEVRDRKAK